MKRIAGKSQVMQDVTMLCDQAIDSYLNVLGAPSARISTHSRTWSELSSHLELLTFHFDLSNPRFDSNQLSMLLTPDDSDFLDAILMSKRQTFRFDAGELGHIGLARLYAMCETYKTKDRQLYTRAGKAINFALTSANFDGKSGMFDCETEQLRAEVYNLLIHSRDYPNNKVVWLGTGNAVINYKNAHPNEGTFFNCPSEHITWGLNRAYLHIAAELGYNFMFIEPQLPNIEQAMLSGRASVLIVELLREMRPQLDPNGWVTSQFDGGDQPTATYHECLYLLDKKLLPSVKDCRILFAPLPHLGRHSQITNLPLCLFQRGRAHSSSDSLNLETASLPDKFERDNLFRAPLLK